VSAELTYDYAIIRVMPRVDRGEQVNVGVILSCPDANYLDARIELDDALVLALDPHVDVAALRANLGVIPAVCRGGVTAGPIGARADVSDGSSHRAAPSSSRHLSTRAGLTIPSAAWNSSWTASSGEGLLRGGETA
jgi:hypothetical protein